jgi:trigger factor
MHSQVEAISPILVEVKLEVPWTKVNESLEAAYRNLQRTAKVRGFRPGKVPRNVVISLMGKAVERDVTERLFEEGLREAVVEHALDPVAVTDVPTPTINQGQPLHFNIKVEVRPKIESVDTSAIVVDRTFEAVTDAQVTAEIDKLREQNAELVAPAVARPAESSDVLTVQIEVSVDGVPRPDLASSDTRATLGENRLLAELEAGLMGASVGESKEVNLVFPEDYGHEPLRGKPANFKMLVKEMQAKLLPEVDDEFARDLDYESLQAMRDTIRERLDQQAQRQADSRVRDQLIEKLVDANPVPVPPSLVERQHAAMVEELQRLQKMLGRALPWNAEMESQMHGNAERKVRAGLLLGAIARQRQIAVSDDEIDAKLGQIALQTGKHIAKVRAEYPPEERDGLRSQLLHDKLLEYLRSQATIRDAAAGAVEDKPMVAEQV